MKPEVKIGIVTTIGLAILAILIIWIGDYQFGQGGYRFTVVFNYVSGLSDGAPVKVSGMDAGEVKKVYLKDNKVYTVVWIKNNIKIERDAFVTINTMGLVGEKYVEIALGKKKISPIKNGDVLVGIDPVNISEMLARSEMVVYKLERTVTILNKLMGEEDLLKNLDTTIENLAVLTSDGREIMSKYKKDIGSSIERVASTSLLLREILEENRKQIKEAISDFRKASTSLSKISSDKDGVSELITNLNKTAAGLAKLSENVDPEELRKAIIDLSEAANSVKSSSAKIGGIADENKEALQEGMAKWTKGMKELDKTLTGLSSMMGSGTLGLLQNEDVASSLAKSAKNLEELSSDLKKNPWKLLKKK
ncbi:MAG: MlaD family protein [bacterium]|nr:MlaD family protein [bacterium]